MPEFKDLAALLCLPWCVGLPKSFTEQKVKTFLPKDLVADSFLLHVPVSSLQKSHYICNNLSFTFLQDPQDVKKQIQDLRKRLKDYHFGTLHPHVVIVGPMNAISSTIVVINDKLYDFDSVLDGVEFCYKSLKALRSFPPVCDFVWVFIEHVVYSINSKGTAGPVATAVGNLESSLGIVAKIRFNDY